MSKSLLIVLSVGASLACCQFGMAHAASRTVTLDVSRMTCAACPITVKKALSRIDGVEAVNVSLASKRASPFDDARTSVDALTKATADAGYPSTATAGVPP